MEIHLYARNNTDTSVDMKEAKIMTFVYYREKECLIWHNSLSKRNMDSASRGQVDD